MNTSSLALNIEPESKNTISTQAFFTASLPLVPPGINQSYQPVKINNRLRLAHTPAAKRFLKDAALYLADYRHAQIHDLSLFRVISYSRRHVPLSVSITLYYPTLWRNDLDGPDKIVIDALFAHLKKIAPSEKAIAWNDNRIVELRVEKRADRLQPRVEIELRCALQLVK